MTTNGPSLISPRMQLALIADRVVTRMPGVALTGGADGRWETVSGQHRIRGVIAAADGLGSFELELHVVVSWPPEPLTALAGDLRRRVRAAAKRDGLAEALGSVDVHITGVRGPDDPERDA